MTDDRAAEDRATLTPPSGETSELGSPGAAARPEPWKRYALIVGVLAAVLGALWLIFGDRVVVGLHISGLHSGDGQTRGAHVEALKTHPKKDLVIERLLVAVQDADNAFAVRKICADLLHRHFNRLQKLEQLLRTSDSLHTRGVIFRSLMVEPYFLDEIASEPAFRIRETIDAWLQLQGDLTRASAIQLAVKIDHAEALPHIRPLVRRSGAPSVQLRQERNVMLAAAGAMDHFQECEAVTELLAISAKDPDLLVRLRFMQVVERMVFAPRPPIKCPDAVAGEAMARHVLAALDDEAHEVRMTATLILVRHAEWAEPAVVRLREILAGGGTGAERRHALEALMVVGKPDDVARIPESFHDRSAEVRITAARQVKALKDVGLEGCWIGLLEDETESDWLWRDAVDYLYKFEKILHGRVGFPKQMSLKALNQKGAWAKDLAAIFAGGEVAVDESDGTFMRITRASLAEDHFTWWSKRLLGEDDRDQIDRAVAARRAFYEAKRRGDAQAAQAALEGAPQAVGLWSYEEAWVAIQSR